MTFPHGVTITVHTPGEGDSYGQPVDDWTATIDRTVAGVAFAPGARAENHDLRDADTADATLYLAAGHGITARDRVTVRGHTYDIIGITAEYESPFTGWRPGDEVLLRRVAG